MGLCNPFILVKIKRNISEICVYSEINKNKKHSKKFEYVFCSLELN